MLHLGRRHGEGRSGLLLRLLPGPLLLSPMHPLPGACQHRDQVQHRGEWHRVVRALLLLPGVHLGPGRQPDPGQGELHLGLLRRRGGPITLTLTRSPNPNPSPSPSSIALTIALTLTLTL